MIIGLRRERGSAGRTPLESNIGPEDQRIVGVESTLHVQVDPVVLDPGDIVGVPIGDQRRVGSIIGLYRRDRTVGLSRNDMLRIEEIAAVDICRVIGR